MKATKKGEVSVYMVFKNGAGEITAEHIIAVFRSKNWAEQFIEDYNKTTGFEDCTVELREG